MPLPAFDPSIPVSPDDGREDKIQLSLGAWYVLFKTKSAHEAGVKIAHLRAALMEGKLFSRVTSSDTKQPIPIRVSKGGFGDDETEPYNAGDNLPLFGGELSTTRIYATSKEYPNGIEKPGFNACVRLSFSTFYLNPLRFVRHQALPTKEGGQKWGAVRWFKSGVPIQTKGEFSLTGDDNWIPDSSAWDAFTTPANWQRHLRRYLARLNSLFNGEIRRAINRANDEFEIDLQPAIHIPDYAIRELETAWEFNDSDPLERVRSIKQRLIELGQNELKVSIYKGTVNLMKLKGMETREFNSPGIGLTLRSGFDLRVYAKTNRRIRFEIVQAMGRNRRRLLTEAKVWQAGMSVNKDHSQIPPLLKQARVDAAAMINELVFPTIAEVPNLRIRQSSIWGMFADLANACQDRRSLRDVLAMLITHGNIHKGVKGTRTPEHLNSLIERLKAKRVLVRDAKSKGYHVAPRYRWALEQLRAADSAWIKTLMNCAPPVRQR